ncbi:pulmonary surfactant-associated protein A-like [Protobothrops mucrosquamatus]|uniref:pulmonary surfactant-associated protein A-like n=1 Tax=Protobothrops mucrosquamatus TaxID=103944 RepID=UPI000775D50E|nr:pulmonary surfactant-associated protein A-like [Protobothrops mucrosquamatus]
MALGDVLGLKQDPEALVQVNELIKHYISSFGKSSRTVAITLQAYDYVDRTNSEVAYMKFSLKGFQFRGKTHAEDSGPNVSFVVAALTLEGKIVIAGDKLFASTGKASAFETADLSCQEAQGAIAAPRNLKENKAIQKIVQFYNSSAYLGIIANDVLGTFHFQNGDSLDFTNWYENEPSGPEIEKCVEMYSDGTWNDKICNDYRLVVCQF